MRNIVRTAAFVFLALALSAAPAFAADWVRIVGMSPASPATLAGVPPATPMGPGNSIEIAFTYNLETQASGRIGFYTAGEPGNPPHTGVEIPFAVTKKGQGEGKTRISVQCPPGFAGCTIKTIRFDLFHDQPAPAPLLKLFEGHQPVDYAFTCRHPNDRKPNVAFARPGIYVWGSDPAKKHWVDWNGSVKLTAAESINPHPTPSNGRCAFNVEYYEKETNGVATPPFKNRLYSDGDERAINGPFALTASEHKSIVTQPYLDSGAHGFKVVLDADGNVNETSETDNSGSIRYHLEGRCDSKPSTAPAAAATKH
ncbi:MAG TPA: hypothetical protein VGM13_15715 [Thermoanaerobaculia bacterium]|jgi:hypothetical protein